ncbi:MAG: putative rRNA maturation factor [Clostridiales bacterium]|jgi:probable rRNA maturation factor|nr:putative rRNA maturation factor [Clostridiales bacterium]
MKQTMNIELSNETDRELPEFIESRIEEVVLAVLDQEGFNVDGEVSVLFTDNAGIQSLNAEYRQKNVPTDVLSFPQYDNLYTIDEIPVYLYLGDIVISLEQAALQADEFGHSLEREIFYLVVHSVLHLLGCDHMEESDKRIMREKEKSALKQLGIFK